MEGGTHRVQGAVLVVGVNEKLDVFAKAWLWTLAVFVAVFIVVDTIAIVRAMPVVVVIFPLVATTMWAIHRWIMED